MTESLTNLSPAEQEKKNILRAMAILVEHATALELRENPEVERGEKRRFVADDLVVIDDVWNKLDTEIRDLATRAFPEIAALALRRRAHDLRK